MTDNKQQNGLKQSKPDDRSNNARRIQRNISSTIENIELGEEMIAETSDSELKAELEEKNLRRHDALRGMKAEMAEEIPYSNKKPE